MVSLTPERKGREGYGNRKRMLMRTGSVIYDFYMGIELNPRLGRDFDVKFFTNGHLGMMVWTLM